jgi:uroporphyrinogen decarboxylase
MGILSDLVACGIDLLNPIEVAAGMDPIEIRRHHPHLILVGGIDVSELLPFGTPEQVAEATLALIQAAGPGVLIGSSMELHNDVPLANFQAMVETVRRYRY